MTGPRVRWVHPGQPKKSVVYGYSLIFSQFVVNINKNMARNRAQIQAKRWQEIEKDWHRNRASNMQRIDNLTYENKQLNNLSYIHEEKRIQWIQKGKLILNRYGSTSNSMVDHLLNFQIQKGKHELHM